jgi:hypothetical protein
MNLYCIGVIGLGQRIADGLAATKAVGWTLEAGRLRHRRRRLNLDSAQPSAG